MTRSSIAALALMLSSHALADPPTQVMNIMRESHLKFAPSKVVQGASQAIIWDNPAKPGETSARRTSTRKRATSR
jgi:hypothetical protein